ncbi:MAG: hypothetical protein ACTH1W_03540 [Advenella sp.]
MSIIFRKRPDHTVSVPPEAKEPHLDLHSIDARLEEAPDDDDIPVLHPPTSPSAHPAGRRPAPSMPAPRHGPPPSDGPQAAPRMAEPRMAESAEPASPIGHRVREPAVHIPPPPAVTRSRSGDPHKPAWQDEDDDMPVLMPAQRPTQVPPFDPATGAKSPGATFSSPAAASAASVDDASSFPGHPTAEDYAPFLNQARDSHGHHSKPELYVWSDDENDAFAQAAKSDFTLNRIEPTARRPTFDASLFRAPSRANALASSVAPAELSPSDPSSQMQAEIDALVTELLDESHDYLKRRFLEEIPEIIAKYRHNK